MILLTTIPTDTMRHVYLSVLSICAIAVQFFLAGTFASANDVIGHWDSNFGFVTIRELKSSTDRKRAGTIIGSWTQDVEKIGRIRSGTFDADSGVLEFEYFQKWNNQTGRAKFRLSKDKKSLSGTWKQGSNSGEWTMTRVTGHDLESRVDSIVQNAGVTAGDPGVAVLIIRQGNLELCKSYGMANLRDGRKLTNDTPIEVASISKVFTALLVMQLLDEGKLNLADDVRKYLPELPKYGPRPIAVMDLLHHTSGLPLYTQFQYDKSAKFVGLEEVVPEFAKQQTKFPPLFQTGEKYKYSNTNYMLLALIIQRILGKSYGEVLQEKVCGPLGMKNVWVYQRPDSPRRHPEYGFDSCVGYYKDKNAKFQPNRTLAPNGSEFLLTCGDGYLWASINDFAKLDAGLRTNKLVKAQTMKLAMRPSQTKDGSTNMYGFGFSLANGETGSLRTFGHTGGNDGVRTSFYHDVLLDHSIAVLCNRGDISADDIWNSIDRVLRSEK